MEKLSGRIVVANQYLCNSELIRLDIATEVSERFDCEFIRPRNFMIIICIPDRINLESLNGYNKDQDKLYDL